LVVVDQRLVFSGNVLSRASNERGDAAWLAALSDDPAGRYLLLQSLEAPVTVGEQPRLVWSSREQLPVDGGEPILLGLATGVPHFAISLDGNSAGAIPAETMYMDARTVAPLLPEDEAAIVAQARSMADWHDRTRFCSRCGGPTVSLEGGARRKCEACGERHYPRVDPSIIVLVEHDDRALLVGRRGGAPGWNSCVAGFVEPGESVEEAVAREVHEETGVNVANVSYAYSQPWPFPAALMIGCRARALSTDIRVDGVEIANAGWFTRTEVRAALHGSSDELTLPQRVAIAHHLIHDWAFDSK
jgi:NAD+ diphosphatase